MIFTCDLFLLLSVQSLSCVQLFALHGLQHARPPCPSPAPRVHTNLCCVGWWCHPTTSSSVVPFSFCLQLFPAPGSFPVSQFFSSGGQSMGALALASVIPMNIQGWFPLGLNDLISFQSKGLSRVFSNTIVGKHQFFGAQPSSSTIWASNPTPGHEFEKDKEPTSKRYMHPSFLCSTI